MTEDGSVDYGSEASLSDELLEDYNNPISVSRMHDEGFDSSKMLAKILKKKNSQWEILKIISQNKSHKIKNKVILFKKVVKEDKINQKRGRITNFSMIK